MPQMFLRNGSWLRRSAILVLLLVVNLAGMWPLLSQPAARSLDAFQRYSEFMSAGEALDHALDVEFCGELPQPEEAPADWDAIHTHEGGKLMLLGEATRLCPPAAALIPHVAEHNTPCLRALTPEPPPPRA